MKCNDAICILLGCSAPVIPRKMDDEDGGGFNVIGRAYVYGKMDGEAVMALTKDQLAQQTREFRLI
jgi:hypothetical protein